MDLTCCSQGQCTENIVCQGNKGIGDYCYVSDECMSGYCDTNNNICVGKKVDVITKDAKNVWLLSGCGIFVSIVIFFCMRRWFNNIFYGSEESELNNSNSGE